ncbi:MAG: hypothetical protein RIR91_167 [Verrucomicrobiota bacterium]|jgi:hypothetical protein
MRPAVRFLLTAALLCAGAHSFGQALIFKGGERWEVNDPFKLDNSVPPKPVNDPKKGTISSLKGTVVRTVNSGGTDIESTRKLSEVERIIWPPMDKLAEAQLFVSRGEPSKALDSVEPIIKFFDAFKKTPGSLWLKASMVKLDALDRLENDAVIGAFLDNLEKNDDGSNPELGTKIKLARLMQRARRGEHDTVITEAADLITKLDDPDVLARLHLVKGSSLLATKKYEAAMNTYLRVPVFYGSQAEHLPKALLGAARAFRGMDSPATKEQRLEEISNRYLRDLIATYPVSKEAEEAKKLLPKEDRLAAEAEAAKIKDAAVIPEATAKPDAPKADNANNNEANK